MNPEKPAQVLVRTPNWLGDAVMSLPALQRLLAHSETLQCAVLVPEPFLPLYQCLDGLQRIWTLPKGPALTQIVREWNFSRRMNKENYSHCIVFPNSFHSALIPAMARIPIRIGFNKDGRKVLLTHPVKPPKDFFANHHSQHYLNLIRTLDCLPADTPIHATLEPLTPSNTLNPTQKTLLREVTTFAQGDSLIGICPGAAYGPAKMWPLEKFKEITHWLCQKNHIRICILGTQKEKQAGDFLAESNPKIKNLTGQTDLLGLLHLLKMLRGMLTNDSGAMHLGGALGIPVLALFGSTAPLATSGLGPVTPLYKKVDCSPCFSRTCARKDMLCMNSITVNEVKEHLESWLTKPSS